MFRICLLVTLLFLTLSLAVFAAGDQEWVNCCKKAQLAAQQQHFSEAESLYNVALTEAKKFGNECSRVGITTSGLAAVYEYKGDYAKAESLFKQALAIEEKTLGADSPHIASCLNNISSLYSRMGKSAAAIPYAERALEIMKKARGENSSEVLMIRQNLAELKMHTGGDSLSELKETLAKREALVGPEHADVAQCLNNLAQWYLVHGQYSDAEPLYKRSLAISNKQLGPQNQYTLAVTQNLGTLYLEEKKFDLAEPLLKLALEGREKALGEKHPDVGHSLEEYAKLLRATGRSDQAGKLEERAAAISQRQH